MIFGFTYGEILVLLPVIVGFLSVIAKYTPNKSDDKIVQMLWDLINIVGMNTGKAGNAERPITLKLSKLRKAA